MVESHVSMASPSAITDIAKAGRVAHGSTIVGWWQRKEQQPVIILEAMNARDGLGRLYSRFVSGCTLVPAGREIHMSYKMH